MTIHDSFAQRKKDLDHIVKLLEKHDWIGAMIALDLLSHELASLSSSLSDIMRSDIMRNELRERIRGDKS